MFGRGMGRSDSLFYSSANHSPANQSVALSPGQDVGDFVAARRAVKSLVPISS
jgi:hypothetical protein